MTGEPFSQPTGLTAIEAERTRQIEDTLASFAEATDRAANVAGSVRRTGRLLMLGMGASHAANRMVEGLYRGAGIDTFSLPASEHLAAPVSTQGRTLLLTSQSGESAEIVRWLRENDRTADVFGLTLAPRSSLGQAVPCLVGHGGVEKAFAATRSITVSLGLHLAVLAALGIDPEPALATLKAGDTATHAGVPPRFADVGAVVTSGRALQGLAEAIALGIMELARIPAFALDGGQVRHGPPEMFGPEVGLVFFRSAEPGAASPESTVSLAATAGSPVLVLDTSGEAALAGADTVALPKASGMAAIFAALLPAQRFMLQFASARVTDVGTPRRSSKITSTE